MCRLQLKQTICCPIFVISSLLLYLIMIVGVYQDISLGADGSSTLQLFEYSMVYATAGIILPIPAVLPIVWYISDDLEGASYLALLRSGKRDYYLGKISAAIISSGAVVAAASFLFCVTTKMTEKPTGPSMFTMSGYNNPLLHMFDKQEWWILLLVCHIFARMVFASICGMFSLCLSAFTGNRYVLAGAPVVGCLGVSYFSQALRIQSWLNPFQITLEYFSTLDGNGLLHTIAYQFIAYIFFGIVYWKRQEGRFRDG